MWAGTLGTEEGVLVALVRWGLGQPGDLRRPPAPTGTAAAARSPPGRPGRPGGRPVGDEHPAADRPTARHPAASATPGRAQAATSTTQPVPDTRELVDPVANRLPRWRGFNLQEMFNKDLGVRKFEERDFARIADWASTRPPAPGLPGLEPRPGTGCSSIRGCSAGSTRPCSGPSATASTSTSTSTAPRERRDPAGGPKSLWTDEEAQRACVTHWAHFAKRYAGRPNKRLSFDLCTGPPKIAPEVHRAVVGRVLDAIRKADGGRR